MTNAESSTDRANRFYRPRIKRLVLPPKPEGDELLAMKLQQEEYGNPLSPVKRSRDSCYDEEPAGSPSKSARQISDSPPDLVMSDLDLDGDESKDDNDEDAGDRDFALRRS